MKNTVLFIVIGFSAFAVSCNRNKYEVIERSEKEVPNFTPSVQSAILAEHAPLPD